MTSDAELLRQVRVGLITLLKCFAEGTVEDEVRQSEVFCYPAEPIDNLLVILRQLCLEDLLEGLFQVLIAAEEARKVLNTVL